MVAHLELVGKLIQGFIGEAELRNSGERMKELVRFLLEKGVVYREEGGFAAPDRIALVESLLAYGFTAEYLASFFTWRDFEAFSDDVLFRHGYSSLRNFRFSRGGRRFEVDILALKKPLVLCVECKHYKKPKTTMLSKQSIERHIERAKALAESMESLTLSMGVSGWGRLKVVPFIITLTQEGMYKEIPIIPVFKLNTFLLELDQNINSICFFEAEASSYRKID
ncbi:MAG: restriction endonuclease [Candidatus Freyarchaeota archaeon]|nr:restriction endonuclease [Candidatus Jordarchaeia archaeon]